MPPQDRFSGSIVSGSGAYKDARGQVAVYLRPHGSGRTRRVKLTVRGARCGAQANCVTLSGVMSGKLTVNPPPIADTGSRFALTVAGPISPLGAVSATGHGRGTGFIARGRETLVLVLRGARGQIRLRLLSGRVRGFTSP